MHTKQHIIYYPRVNNGGKRSHTKCTHSIILPYLQKFGKPDRIDMLEEFMFCNYCGNRLVYGDCNYCNDNGNALKEFEEEDD